MYFLECTVNKSMKNLITIALITAGQVKRNRIQNRLQNSVQPAGIPMLLPHVTEARDTASQRLLVFAFPSLIVTGIGWLKPLQIWLLHSYYGRVNIRFFFSFCLSSFWLANTSQDVSTAMRCTNSRESE